MTKKELIEKLDRFDDNAEIITYNRTSKRWFKTGAPANYPIETIAEMTPKCGSYSQKQLAKFNNTDIAFFF